MTADDDRAGPRRILIVLLGSLGDIARGMAVLRPLERRWPEAHITWLVEPRWVEFVRLHPAVDAIEVFDRPRGLRAVRELRRRLRTAGYDLVLDLQRHFKSGVFSRFTAAPRRIGFHRRNSKELNWLFQTEHIAPADERVESKVRHYLRFVESLGIAFDDRVEFGLPPPPADIARRLLDGPIGRYVAVVMGSSWSSKNWVREGYVRLLGEIGRWPDPPVVVLVGDKSQTDEAAAVARAAPPGRVRNLVGATSLTELTAILGHALVAVGPDSGPGHISAALGTPYVGLFGPTDARRVGPWGSSRWAVSAHIGCAPCRRRECPGLDRICMRLLEPDLIARHAAAAAAERADRSASPAS